MTTFAIARHEFRSFFRSPFAWVLLGLTQLLLAWVFLLQLEGFLSIQAKLKVTENSLGLTDLVANPLLGAAASVLLLIVPILCMGLLSAEYRNGTYRLLFSAPIPLYQIVLGKYLGLLSFLLLIVAVFMLMPLALLTGGNLDLSKLAAGLLGLILVCASTAAIGLFISSLTHNPATAAIGAFGLLLFLWLIGMAGADLENGSPVFNWLSLQYHLQPMLKGLVRSSDIIYYLSLTAAFLTLTVHRLDVRRSEN